MAIRKRSWKNGDGSISEKWIATIGSGKNRQSKQFDLKKDASKWVQETRAEIGKGTHVADSKTVTVRVAGEKWIDACKAVPLEPTTIAAYRNHLDLHIYPYLGDLKLSALTLPVVRRWQDNLHEGKPAPGTDIAAKRSGDMIRRCTVSLGALLDDAIERGFVGKNVVKQHKRKHHTAQERHQKKKLVVGEDIPTPAEVDAILKIAEHDLALFLVLFRCGLRASELRGMCWHHIDLDAARPVIHIRERADRYNVVGRPKSEAGDRTIPIPPSTVKALKEWKLRCPRRGIGEDDAGKPLTELRYVFPNGKGNIENRSNIVQRRWWPAQIKAGVAVPALNDKGKPIKVNGKPVMLAKYTGLHAARHFFASWCINPQPMGCGLTPKAVQERMGHSNINITMDRYGHLFPVTDDTAMLAAAEGKHG